MNKNRNRSVSVRCTRAWKERLRRAARRQGLSTGALARQAIAFGLVDWENLTAAAEAARAEPNRPRPPLPW